MAADLPYAKSREIVESLGTSNSDPISSLLSSRILTESERKRLSRIDTRALESAVESGIVAVPADEFGQQLAESLRPPLALFAWGDKQCLLRPMIAIVGTRAASTYGRAVAQKFGEHFARSGVIVASGGAMGIDTCAHEGALAAGGQTVAVLPGGVDVPQPPKNKGLFDRIRESGCLVSPYAVGSPAFDHRFEQRNHLIAAMSLCVVVVEAPSKSGALMTCSAAADLGRSVFVVPGSIDMPGFRGSHRLVRDGATLVDDPAQVLEEMGIESGASTEDRGQLTERQSAIMTALSAEPQSAESIVPLVSASSADILADLTMLELEGYVIKSAMGYSVKP